MNFQKPQAQFYTSGNDEPSVKTVAENNGYILMQVSGRGRPTAFKIVAPDRKEATLGDYTARRMAETALALGLVGINQAVVWAASCRMIDTFSAVIEMHLKFGALIASVKEVAGFDDLTCATINANPALFGLGEKWVQS